MKLFSRNSRIPMVILEVRGYFFTKNSRFWEFSLRNFRLGILEFHIEILGSSRGMTQGLGILEFLWFFWGLGGIFREF